MKMSIIKTISLVSNQNSINDAFSALSKIKSSLKKLDMKKFDDDKLTERYNNLMEEIDADMKSLRKKQS